MALVPAVGDLLARLANPRGVTNVHSGLDEFDNVESAVASVAVLQGVTNLNNELDELSSFEGPGAKVVALAGMASFHSRVDSLDDSAVSVAALLATVNAQKRLDELENVELVELFNDTFELEQVELFKDTFELEQVELFKDTLGLELVELFKVELEFFDETLEAFDKFSESVRERLLDNFAADGGAVIGVTVLSSGLRGLVGRPNLQLALQGDVTLLKTDEMIDIQALDVNIENVAGMEAKEIQVLAQLVEDAEALFADTEQAAVIDVQSCEDG
ncbi:hypothetical protein QBC47DRAFT_393059 [Echria macrotheca]|uniref:Uncharacterized protein n=1 Tax=Echria macrotheca TaxID=438768 RepID=A0AAJ0B4C3_9PEZI|nr:hypothetical protein QBC47DRAFT_393059 [Echria macrotheca]